MRGSKWTRMWTTAAVAAALAAGGAWAHEGHEHGGKDGGGTKPAAGAVDVTGEVIDVACYIDDGKDARGDKHKACATACLKKGLPVGLLTDDGQVVLAVTADHGSATALLLPYVARRVKATGKLSVQGPYQLLAVAKVEPAGKAGAAAAAPGPKEVWTCPMDGGEYDKPGKCPTCGMNLEKKKG